MMLVVDGGEKSWQLICISVEWTQIATRYLREQLAKIAEFYHVTSNQGSGSVAVPPEVEQALKQWEYNEKLTFYMFQVTFSEVTELAPDFVVLLPLFTFSRLH